MSPLQSVATLVLHSVGLAFMGVYAAELRKRLSTHQKMLLRYLDAGDGEMTKVLFLVVVVSWCIFLSTCTALGITVVSLVQKLLLNGPPHS